MNNIEIKEIRNRFGFTQTQFGEMLGVTLRSVQRWESGEHIIPEPTARLLAQKLKELETEGGMTGTEIKEIREKLSLTQPQFAEFLGVGLSSVTKWESGVNKMSESVQMLLREKLKSLESAPSQKPPPQPDAALVENVHFMRVPVVPVNAYAGFLNGYFDESYMEEMPYEYWEVDREYRGRYVVFEVKGDSMDDGSRESIFEHDKLLCREVQLHLFQDSKLHINKWNFVIMHREKGIVVKRIIAHDVEKKMITLHSLNPFYEDYTVSLTDVVAVFNVVDLKRSLKL